MTINETHIWKFVMRFNSGNADLGTNAKERNTLGYPQEGEFIDFPIERHIPVLILKTPALWGGITSPCLRASPPAVLILPCFPNSFGNVLIHLPVFKYEPIVREDSRLARGRRAR